MPLCAQPERGQLVLILFPPCMHADAAVRPRKAVEPPAACLAMCAAYLWQPVHVHNAPLATGRHGFSLWRGWFIRFRYHCVCQLYSEIVWDRALEFKTFRGFREWQR